MRFAVASAGLKCTRFGGSTGAPRRPRVEALLAQSEASFGGLTGGRAGM
jgi:sulfofructose kinase